MSNNNLIFTNPIFAQGERRNFPAVQCRKHLQLHQQNIEP